MQLSLSNFYFRLSSLVRAPSFHLCQSYSCFSKSKPYLKEWCKVHFVSPVQIYHYQTAIKNGKRFQSSYQKYTNEDELSHVDDLHDEDGLPDQEELDDTDHATPQKEKMVFPQNKEHPEYKDIHFHCNLSHAFVVAQNAFNMKEEEIDNFFYDGRFRINTKRVGKRNAKIKTGDLIDLIEEVTDTDVTMKRVQVLNLEIKEVAKKGKDKQKHKSTPKKRYLIVRRWKHLKVKRI